MSIEIIINDKIKVWSKVFYSTQKNIVAEFNYNYAEPFNWITIRLTGEEQKDKLFIVESISINSQKLKVYSGFYTVYPNNFWNNLNESDKNHMKSKVLSHGGMLGWFGEIQFEFFDLKYKSNIGKHHSNTFGVNKIIL